MQGLLNHTVTEEVDDLDGMYKQAFDRIMNQVVAPDLLLPPQHLLAWWLQDNQLLDTVSTFHLQSYNWTSDTIERQPAKLHMPLIIRV